MYYVIHRFTLDLHKSGIQTTIQGIKRGNSGGNVLEISLTQSGQPYILENCTVVFRAVTSNNAKLYNSCGIKDNKVIYYVTTNTVASGNETECQLQIISPDNQVLFAPRFRLEIEDEIYTDTEIEAQDEFTALTTETNKAAEYADYAALSASAAAQSAQEAENSETAAETAATAAEAQALAAGAAKSAAVQAASDVCAAFEAVVVCSAQTAPAITVENNKDYRFSAPLTALTLSLPSDLETEDRYAAMLTFQTVSGADMAFTYSTSDLYFTNDDCEEGVFIPLRNKQYDVAIWWNGSRYQGVVRGVAL